jgi:hypothetical protein
MAPWCFDGKQYPNGSAEPASFVRSTGAGRSGAQLLLFAQSALSGVARPGLVPSEGPSPATRPRGPGSRGPPPLAALETMHRGVFPGELSSSHHRSDARTE